MLPAGKENSGSGSVDLAVYWLTVQKFAGVTPEGTLNVWNQRFWGLCTSSIETAERRSMQFSLSGVARGIVFEHWILYGSSRDIGPSRAFNWHWGGVITSISEVCIAMSRKRWTTWPRLLFTTNISSVIWDILTQLKIDIKSLFPLFPLFQNQPDQTSVKHPARIHESCSLCDPGYYTLSSHRGKRATVDDHTQRGRWLRLPRKACRGRKLWCVRCDYDRDALFNSVIVYITSIRRYRLYLIISTRRPALILSRPLWAH